MRAMMDGGFKHYVAGWNNLHVMAVSFTNIGMMTVHNVTPASC